MKSSELENHIRERLGDQSHRFNLYHDMTYLMLRYRWIGDKLFDIDPENPLAPCFLSHDAFLLFALIMKKGENKILQNESNLYMP